MIDYLPSLMARDAHEKQCGAPFTAEGKRQPVLPSPRMGKVVAKPPDEVPFKLHTAYEMEEERLLDRG